MYNIMYTPYVRQEQVLKVPDFEIPVITRSAKRQPIILNLPQEDIDASEVVETPSIVRGVTTFKTPDIRVGNMQDVLDKFNEHGISVRVTSGFRPDSVTASGNASHHSYGNAIDITPGEGETWDTMRTKLKNSPTLVKWLRDNGYGILDETKPDIMAQTHATGAHWHIGPDRKAVEGLFTLIAKRGGILKAQNGTMLESNFPEPYQKQFNLEFNPFKQGVKPPLKPEKKIELAEIPGTNMANLNQIADKLKAAGFTAQQSAAILATVAEESKANPLSIGDNGKAKGLFQWHGNRFTATDDLDSQIDLIIKEIRDYKNSNGWLSSALFKKYDAIDAFNGNDLENVVSALTANFIRPKHTEYAIGKRYNLAKQIYEQLK